MNGLSVCVEIFRIILSHIHLSSEKVSSKSEIGHVPTFENLVHLTWNDPQIRCASLYLSSREKVPFYISTGCCLQFVKQRQCIHEFRKLLFSAVIYFLTSWVCTFYLIYTIFKWLQKLHKCWFSYQASVVDTTINLWHPKVFQQVICFFSFIICICLTLFNCNRLT